MIVPVTLIATGNEAKSSAVMYGKIKAIHVNYASDANANTDVVFTDSHGQSILTLTDNKTDCVKYPRAYAQDPTGTDLTYDGSNEIPTEFVVCGTITMTVAQNTTGKVTTATVMLEV